MIFNLILFFQSVFLPPDLDSLQKGISNIYRLNFLQSTQTFQWYIKTYPNRPEGYFLIAMVDWWKVMLLVDDETTNEQFLKNIDKSIDQLSRLEKDPVIGSLAEYYKSGSIGFKARFYINEREWLKSARLGASAYPILEKALNKELEFVDIRFGTGIYRYFASWVPEKVPILKPVMWFFPDGDKIQGLKDLNSVADEGILAQTETKYFLMHIYLHYENNHIEAKKLGIELTATYPENPLFKLQLAYACLFVKDFKTSKSIYQEIFDKTQQNEKYYWKGNLIHIYYGLGAIQNSEGNLKKAAEYYQLSMQFYRKIQRKSERKYYFATMYDLSLVHHKLGDVTSARNIALQLATEAEDSYWKNRASTLLKMVTK